MYRLSSLLSLLAAALAAVTVSGQGDVCPDGTRCSDGSCCMTIRPNEPYGCCPFLDGVCCADMLHCCPQNFHCDLDQGMCLPGPVRPDLQRLGLLTGRRAGGGGPSVPLARSAPAPATAAVASTPCPDGKTSCSATATCCQTKTGDYACCPEADAVCCPDHIHCCPKGTKCDVKDRTCLEEQKHPILTLV